MLGLMQDQPLLISALIDFAAATTADARDRVAPSRRRHPPLHLCARPRARARRWPARSTGWGWVSATVSATLAWNGYRHFELYFGIAGSGRVMHTINPRLAPEQVAWIANHAEDQVLCFDMTFLPIVKAIWSQLQDGEALGRAVRRRQRCRPTPASRPAQLRSTGSAPRPSDYAWPEFDERSAAALCYTSGTTGNPKGALYSHRSTILHAYGAALPDAHGMSARESSCRWCRCSTSTPGASRTAPR